MKGVRYLAVQSDKRRCFSSSSQPPPDRDRDSHGSINFTLPVPPSPSPSPLSPPSSPPLPSSSTPLSLPPIPHSFPVPRVSFSTQRFVRALERNGFERGVANVLMQVSRELLGREEGRAGGEMLSKGDLENEAYLNTAALTELKTETTQKSRNDSIKLRSLTSSLQRDMDSISQRLKEDIQSLKSDIQLEMNGRKEETGGDLKGFDRKTMDLNSKFTILLGEVRTEIETTKWISTRRVMTAIVVIVVSIIGLTSLSPSTKPAPTSPPTPPVEAFGVTRENEGEEADAILPLIGVNVGVGGIGGKEGNGVGGNGVKEKEKEGGGGWWWSGVGGGGKEERVKGEVEEEEEGGG